MCYFISGLVDIKTKVEKINTIGEDYAILFAPCDNTFVQSQLKSNEMYIARKKGDCDCATDLGLIARVESRDTAKVQKKELQKLQKKGWSESKIQRWLGDKEKKSEKDGTKKDRIINGAHIDGENWLKYIKALFADTDISHFGLLLHRYKGGVDSEMVKLQERKTVRINDLTADILLRIDEDVMYDIKR